MYDAEERTRERLLSHALQFGLDKVRATALVDRAYVLVTHNSPFVVQVAERAGFALFLAVVLMLLSNDHTSNEDVVKKAKALAYGITLKYLSREARSPAISRVLEEAGHEMPEDGIMPKDVKVFEKIHTGESTFEEEVQGYGFSRRRAYRHLDRAAAAFWYIYCREFPLGDECQ